VIELDTICPKCQKRVDFEVKDKHAPHLCPHCGQDLLAYTTDNFWENKPLDQCPVCSCTHLYRQKDFNRKLGLALVVVGVALAYFTYGISILVLALLDVWLYRRVGEIACCYQCGTVFRNVAEIQAIEPFQLTLFDYYRNLKPA